MHVILKKILKNIHNKEHIIYFNSIKTQICINVRSLIIILQVDYLKKK